MALQLTERLEEAGLHPQRISILGFSGGPDSASLLHALQAAGWPVLAAHLDHGLRPDSAEDARRASARAAAYGVPFASQQADVARRAAAEKLSLEEAARAERYAFLFRLAAEQDAQAVLVAHTADDQAETILMHLLRGAGPGGLRGMRLRLLPNPWSGTIPLVRPLLETSRAEVLAYCAEHELQPLQDPTNLDTAFFRNRLRHEVLPQLERLTPGFKQRLRQTGDLLAADLALLDELTEAAWRRCLAQRGAGYLGLGRAAFLAQPLALQRGVVRRAASTLRPAARDLGYALVEQAVNAAARPQSGPQHWFGGLVLLCEGETLWLAEREAQLPAAWPQAPEQAVHVEAPGGLMLNAGWRLELGEAQAARATGDHYEAWFDVGRAGVEFSLRRPRPSDRIALAAGSQKLSDVFINAKLPRRARAAWPLLCKGDEIIWAPGLRAAAPYVAQAGQPALRAQLVRG